MKKAAMALVAVALLAGAGAVTLRRVLAQAPAKPLRASEVLALVAGDAMPENVAHHLEVSGVAFRPNDAYRDLLKRAGADATVMSALGSAKIAAEEAPEAESGNELMEHLATAGALIHGKRYEDAARELTEAVTASFKSADCGFVMGEALRQEEDWERAEAVYEELLRLEPNFPEARNKLSFVLYRMKNAEGAAREAQAELRIWKGNAEAHKNAGLALYEARKYRAAVAEYDEALRLHPAYGPALIDRALAYDGLKDLPEAIAAYQKAEKVLPDDAVLHYNLANDLDAAGQKDEAIREYREAKRSDPARFDARQNLGNALMMSGKYQDAVAEFRDLVRMYPDAEMSRVGLAMALFRIWDFAGAEAEDQQAIEMDPTDAFPHINLGDIREEQRKYDEAVAEFLTAERLDSGNIDAYRGAIRVLTKKGDFAAAVEQSDMAERVSPSDANIHSLRAKSLAGAGRADEAIAEYWQAIALDGSQVQTIIELGDVFEKKGDWAAAIAAYKKASLADVSTDFRGKMMRVTDRNPQKEYGAAQERLKQHLAALRSAGKNAEATQIETAIRTAESSAGISEQLDVAMKAGFDADQRHEWDEARRQYRRAVELAEKLQPQDVRVVTALDDLGNQYLGSDAAEAQKNYEQELKVAVQLFGPQSGNLVGPLTSLGRNAIFQKDYPTAEQFFSQALDISEKAFGDGSDKVAHVVVDAASMYFAQKDYAKSEAYLLRALHIEETLYGTDGVDTLTPRWALCTLYDRSGQTDKLATCDQRLATAVEKQYGANSPMLVQILVSESKALRATGKASEADLVDNRVAQIRAAATKAD